MKIVISAKSTLIIKRKKFPKCIYMINKYIISIYICVCGRIFISHQWTHQYKLLNQDFMMQIYNGLQMINSLVGWFCRETWSHTGIYKLLFPVVSSRGRKHVSVKTELPPPTHSCRGRPQLKHSLQRLCWSKWAVVITASRSLCSALFHRSN